MTAACTAPAAAGALGADAGAAGRACRPRRPRRRWTRPVVRLVQQRRSDEGLRPGAAVAADGRSRSRPRHGCRPRSIPGRAACSVRTTRASRGRSSATATRVRCTSASCASIRRNDKTIYVAGLPVAKSLDGGKTFATLDAAGGNGEPGHVDQHAIWIDPKNPKHLMIGNDGGLDISWDQGRTWDFVNTMATALAYVVTADMRHPYFVYVGLQDNGSWGGPSAVRGRGGIMNSDWFGIGGGDGFYTAVDPSDYNNVITESQDGNTNRYDLRTGRGDSIRPRAPEAARGGAGGGRRGVAGAARTGNVSGPSSARPARLHTARSGRRRGGAAGRPRRPAERAQRAARRSVPLQLEHAGRDVAAQPEDRLAGRQPPVQVVQPGRHVGGERRSHEADRSEHRLDDGRRRAT